MLDFSPGGWRTLLGWPSIGPALDSQNRSGLQRETIERLAKESAARFESLVFTREAYDELATLIHRVAEEIGDGSQTNRNHRAAIQLLVDDELVPMIAYEFIQRFGWPPQAQ